MPDCPFCKPVSVKPILTRESAPRAAGCCRATPRTSMACHPARLAATGEGTADQQRFDQTLDSAAFPSEPVSPQGRKGGTVDEQQIARTLASDQFPSLPADGAAQDAAEKPRSDQTLDSGSFASAPESPSAPAKDMGKRTIDQQQIGRTLDSSGFPALPADREAQNTAEKPRIDQTLDSGSFAPALPSSADREPPTSIRSRARSIPTVTAAIRRRELRQRGTSPRRMSPSAPPPTAARRSPGTRV